MKKIKKGVTVKEFVAIILFHLMTIERLKKLWRSLASFYFFRDRQCLDQAVMVYKNQDVNLEKVRNWSENEGESDNHQIFLNRIKH